MYRYTYSFVGARGLGVPPLNNSRGVTSEIRLRELFMLVEVDNSNIN